MRAGRQPAEGGAGRQRAPLRCPSRALTSGLRSITRTCGRSCSIPRWSSRPWRSSPSWPGMGLLWSSASGLVGSPSPLDRRGVPVHGVELSEAMVAQLRTPEGGPDIAVTIGDFATTAAGGPFTLVYLVRNTITNLTTQDEQVETFRNAAGHLQPGGCFVIENYVPELRRLPPGETVHRSPRHRPTSASRSTTSPRRSRSPATPGSSAAELRTFSSPHRVCVAVRTRSDRPDRRTRAARAVDRLAPGGLHRREPEPRLGLAETGPSLNLARPPQKTRSTTLRACRVTRR